MYRALIVGAAVGFLLGFASSCGNTQAHCLAANCDGCCDANDQCQPGTSPDACGRSALACAVCGGGQSCVNGGCSDGGGSPPDSGTKKPCGPTTCSGCCDTKGNCQVGTSLFLCGSGGGSCGQCPAADYCDAGTCVAASCSSTNCPNGCCQGNQCVTNTNAAECGKGGAQCVSCTSPAICQSGACYLDGGSQSGGDGGGSCDPFTYAFCQSTCTGCCSQSDCTCHAISGGCGGCCDAYGNCSAGNSDSSCGSQGSACTDCSIDILFGGNGTCDAGQCV